MSASDTVFKAVAHPARRKMLSLLAIEPRSVKELTALFAISQPAISQHLKELKEADLVASERFGIEQRYRLTPRPLRHILDWSEPYRSLLDPQGHAWKFVSASRQGTPSAGRSRLRRTSDGY